MIENFFEFMWYLLAPPLVRVKEALIEWYFL